MIQNLKVSKVNVTAISKATIAIMIREKLSKVNVAVVFLQARVQHYSHSDKQT